MKKSIITFAPLTMSTIIVFITTVMLGAHKGEFQGKMPTVKPTTVRTAYLFKN